MAIALNQDVAGVSVPKTSNIKASARALGTKGNEIMYLAACISIFGLFMVNTTFNAITGWYQGGMALMFGYAFLDIAMSYFLSESFNATIPARKVLATAGFVLTFSCSLISLYACVMMFDANRSVDYTKVEALAAQLDDMKWNRTIALFSGNPTNGMMFAQRTGPLGQQVTDAKHSAVSELGYAPEHAAFKADGSIFQRMGVDMGSIRIYMCAVILVTCLIGLALFKVDWTDDGEVELVSKVVKNPDQKPRRRVYGLQGDGKLAANLDTPEPAAKDDGDAWSLSDKIVFIGGGAMVVLALIILW